MFWLKIAEFFTDETQRMSMSRLLLFQSFYVAALVLVIDTMKHGLNEILFGIFIGAFTGTYVGGKWADRKAAPVALPVPPAPIIVQQAPGVVNTDGATTNNAAKVE